MDRGLEVMRPRIFRGPRPRHAFAPAAILGTTRNILPRAYRGINPALKEASGIMHP
jgi:hypothetical protein